MCKNTLSTLEFDASTSKRAQYEAFDFELAAPGLVTVRNESYADADEHSYRVNVENGVLVACECPADMYHNGACKHRVAVAIREPVLEAATEYENDQEPEVVTDGGTTVDGQGLSREWRISRAIATASRRLRTFRAGRAIAMGSGRRIQMWRLIPRTEAGPSGWIAREQTQHQYLIDEASAING